MTLTDTVHNQDIQGICKKYLPVNDKSVEVRDVEEYKSLLLLCLLGFPGDVRRWKQLK